jgi:hypothetical protein
VLARIPTLKWVRSFSTAYFFSRTLVGVLDLSGLSTLFSIEAICVFCVNLAEIEFYNLLFIVESWA